MIKKSTKLYLVTWDDSSGNVDNMWEFISNMEKPKRNFCISVGWITHETKHSIRVVPHISGINIKHVQGCGQGIMEIPKSAIIKKKELKWKMKK
jgi:flavoprotein